MKLWVVVAFSVAALASCGGAVTEDRGSAGQGGTGGSFAPGRGGTSGKGGSAGARDGGKDARADARDAGNDYVEDLNCPDVPPVPPRRECDPFATRSGCAPGMGCYPFVEYPTGPCDKEDYGTACRVPGNSRQGESCGSGSQCAAGFVCVITGQGTQCVELCQLGQPGQCPPGLFCVPIDVEGFGGCF